MKINKKNPTHWLILLTSAGLVLLALPARLFRSRRAPKRIVFYGHKLNGNLLALYEYGLHHFPKWQLYFLSIDPQYIQTLKGEVRVLSGLRFMDVLRLVCADAIISDHGLHHFVLLRKLTGMRFIDVWHGIPYKGFDADDFGALHPYDQIWVSSPTIGKFYTERFGFKPSQVKITGYARAERLRHYPLSKNELRKKYGLKNTKTLLVAPTWKQDAAKRAIIPFGLSLEDFIKCLQAAYGKELQIIFRAHLNVRDTFELTADPLVKLMPYAKFPVAEDFLAVSDVLLTDWSSIAFDALAINMPTVFMDVPPPFRKGLCLGPEYRFGATPSIPSELQKSLQEALTQPERYQRTYQSVINKTLKAAYGDTLDGEVCQRSFALLRDLLED